MEMNTTRIPSALTTTELRKENTVSYSSEADAAAVQKKSRPRSVTFAAMLQLLIALAFLSAPIVGFVYGADAQAAAEAEVVRQGFPAAVLAENNIAFDEGGAATVLPVVVALGMTTLALLNMAGKRVGQILSWIFQPIVLAGNVAIMASQRFAAQAVESAFESSGNATLQSIDVQALLDAAESGFPGWLPYLVNVRFVVVTLGSVLVIVLLAIRSARAYFRKAEPAADQIG
jgi:hypothetical protein